MRLPCLPSQDAKSSARTAKLEKRRAEYTYAPMPSASKPDPAAASDKDRWVAEVVARYFGLAQSIHLRDEYTPSYIARVLELDIQLRHNHKVSDIKGLALSETEHDSVGTAVEKAFRLLGRRPHEGMHGLFRKSTYAAADRLRNTTEAHEFSEYGKMFGSIAREPIANWYGRGQLFEDIVFAWQRLAGMNPMVIKRVVDRLPEKLAVTSELFARTIEGDSLGVAIAEGRVYLADYTALHGAATGDGKYIFGAYALFVQRKRSAAFPDGAFVPVAIQCAPTPGPDNPVWTPMDGWRWAMARTCVQVADANHHQAVAHLGRTHMTIEPFIVSAYRQLAANHPLYVLLGPHFDLTLAINNTAAHDLIAPGGAVEQVLAGTLETSLGLAQTGPANFSVASYSPAGDLAARGLDDQGVLPVFPYRDDTLPVWRAIHTWVEAYLRLYYTSDADVAGDTELQAWLGEVGSPEGGRLGGLDSPDTVTELIELVTFIVWTASAQHSAVNYPQFPYASYMPNMVGASFAAAPTPSTPNEPAQWHAMLPPMANAVVQFDTVYQLSAIRHFMLGEYSEDFDDERVHQPLAAFRAALAQIETENLARDETRLMSYPWLRPSLIAASIHI